MCLFVCVTCNFTAQMSQRCKTLSVRYSFSAFCDLHIYYFGYGTVVRSNSFLLFYFLAIFSRNFVQSVSFTDFQLLLSVMLCSQQSSANWVTCSLVTGWVIKWYVGNYLTWLRPFSLQGLATMWWTVLVRSLLSLLSGP